MPINDDAIVDRIVFLIASDSSLDNMVANWVTEKTGIGPEDFDDEKADEVFYIVATMNLEDRDDWGAFPTTFSSVEEALRAIVIELNELYGPNDDLSNLPVPKIAVEDLDIVLSPGETRVTYVALLYRIITLEGKPK